MFPAGSLISREILEFRCLIEGGKSEELCLRNFACSIDYPDIQLFRVAMILARREGAALSECLQRLARVTRQRQSFNRKVKAAIAMQKMAAWGIAGCSLTIGVVQYVSNPQALKIAWSHPLGHSILLSGLALLGLGLIWMNRLAVRGVLTR